MEGDEREYRTERVIEWVGCDERIDVMEWNGIGGAGPWMVLCHRCMEWTEEVSDAE